MGKKVKKDTDFVQGIIHDALLNPYNVLQEPQDEKLNFTINYCIEKYNIETRSAFIFSAREHKTKGGEIKYYCTGKEKMDYYCINITMEGQRKGVEDSIKEIKKLDWYKMDVKIIKIKKRRKVKH